MGIDTILLNQNFVFLIVPFIALALFALPFWLTFKKTEISSVTSALLLVPFVNIVFMIYVLDSANRQQPALANVE
ncbi:hypothetical protein [Sessilibacter corallicola]|uniref:Uncharacterized protein n=1 Tax=Sessilibacter corallicola TaxID=2904075 RepID=A0ABQ0A8H4_9GAMM|nr:hypothetical protein [Sessilibacter corallicola]MCE2030417.1 hypothetical protein [Sessilibacter corallicola]